MSIKKADNFFSNFNLETIRDFVDKYLSQIIYVVCFLAILIFITLFVSGQRENKEKQLIINYYQAINYLKENKIDNAEDLLKKVYKSKNANENIKTIAGIRLAEVLILKDNQDEAVKIYKEIYEFKKNDEFLRNLSGLIGLSILINQNNPSNYSQIEKLINKMSNPRNPLITLVNEQEGMFEIQRGNKEKGLKILNDLLQQNIDENTRQRVQMIVNIYGN